MILNDVLWPYYQAEVAKLPVEIRATYLLIYAADQRLDETTYIAQVVADALGLEDARCYLNRYSQLIEQAERTRREAIEAEHAQINDHRCRIIGQLFTAGGFGIEVTIGFDGRDLYRTVTAITGDGRPALAFEEGAPMWLDEISSITRP